MKQKIESFLAKSQNRHDICVNVVNEFQCKNVAELGVYKGDYAQNLLSKCPVIDKYIMIDPWRNLSDWNKPANKDNDTFEAFYQETMQKTDFAKEKRIVLRGKTTEIIDQVEDESLDFIYIDGDHTLKGITIDMINFWSKMKPDGIIFGDDFSPSIWQHDKSFEPTMVFPFAVYFAEAVDVKIYGLPYSQFILSKADKGFEFVDLTNGAYKNTGLSHQLNPNEGMKAKIKRTFPGLTKTLRKLK